MINKIGDVYYDPIANTYKTYGTNLYPLPNSSAKPVHDYKQTEENFKKFFQKVPAEKPDGGPAEYYDLPPSPKTLNDLLEYKGDKHWLGDSFHLANIVKAAWRWGIKSGVDKSYDARKFIYSGVRLLLKYQGLEETRATLQKLLDDPQFGGVK